MKKMLSVYHKAYNKNMVSECILHSSILNYGIHLQCDIKDTIGILGIFKMVVVLLTLTYFCCIVISSVKMVFRQWKKVDELFNTYLFSFGK
jgi:hypothetical protein